MRYSLRQLAIFDAVATTGSVSQAAERLALTQSATSMALAQLESLLGRPLFERQNKRMQLTHWGRWLRPKARQLLFDAQQIELGFYDKHLISGEISAAVSQTAAAHLFPELVSRLDNDFPEMRVLLDVKNTEQVIEGVRNYGYELGIIEGRCDDSRLVQEVWCRDHLVIVASPAHPYAKYKAVSFAQLEQAKWILREPGSGVRRIFESAVQGSIDDLDVCREYAYVPVILALIQQGGYLSCLPYLDVAHAIEQGKLVELSVPALTMERPLSFIWRADAVDNPLRDCIRQEARRMIRNSSQLIYRQGRMPGNSSYQD
ncbi:MAG: LysR family transcriptional regulator [Gammaproteobacteria bacterium]|nr:LysR family transcriptional regulator [Gammaproteobacteria bacterium]